MVSYCSIVVFRLKEAGIDETLSNERPMFNMFLPALILRQCIILQSRRTSIISIDNIVNLYNEIFMQLLISSEAINFIFDI